MRDWQDLKFRYETSKGDMAMSDRLNYVKEVLSIEIDNLISLLPVPFQHEFRSKSFIGGGAIYSLYNNKELKDIDFFLDDGEFAEYIRIYFSLYIIGKNRKLKDKKVKISKYRDMKLVVTDNAISIGKYQIITRWSGEPKKVVSEFDFRHNQFYMYKGKIDTLTKWDFLEDNQLRFNDDRPRDISGCILRTKKFVERGFKLSNKEMAKMLIKLNEVGFNERELEILEKAEGNFES